MSDLQEIRRFWPKAVSVRLHGHKICVQPSKGSKFTLTKPHVWWCIADQRGGLWTYYERSTLAAAMAAAGFARRPKGGHSKRRAMLATSAKLHPMLPGKTRIPLESRQRPRKGVRLGRRGRRKARGLDRQYKPTGHDDMVDAAHWALLAQQRLDRGEIGQ